MSHLSWDEVGSNELPGHIEVFSNTLNGWATVVALSRRHEGFDVRGRPIPARLVAEFYIPGMGRCRKATARGSGRLRYVRPGSPSSRRNHALLEELGDNSEYEIEHEHDPEYCPHTNPVFEGLQHMGVDPKLAEIVSSRFQTVGELESSLAWLLEKQGPILTDTKSPEAPVKSKCLYQDIVFCDSTTSDGIYTVGGTPVSECRNPAHEYCYDCLWRAVREEVMNDVIPRCPGSNDLASHGPVGGCGGSDHQAQSGCKCGTCGHVLLSQTQLDEIMNGYFRYVEKPSDQDRQALDLECKKKRGVSEWHSRKVERMWLHYAIRQQGGIKCPDADCEAMILLPTENYVGEVHCPSEACRFHLHPFCSRCFRTAHEPCWASCHEIDGISEEWLRWCREGRQAFLSRAAANDHAYQQHLQQYNQQRDQRHRDLQNAQRNFDDAKRDEEWKAEHCRQCPQCGRIVQKLEGCDQMVCGRDFHGGNAQGGCGHHFNIKEAPKYQAGRVDRKEVTANNLVEPHRVAETRHFFLTGEPWHCSVCDRAIQGPLILCINCPRFAACIRCDSTHDLNVSSVPRCDSASSHQPGHIFRVLFESIGPGNSRMSDGSGFQESGSFRMPDGSRFHQSSDEDYRLALALQEFSD